MSNINNTTFQIIVSITLLSGSILETYGWDSMNFSVIISLLLSFIYVCRYGFSLKPMPKYLIWYFLYAIFAYISSIQTLSSFSNIVPLGVIRTMIAYAMFFSCISLSVFLDIYKRLAVIVVVCFWIQFVVYNTTGNMITGIIPFLPISLSDDSMAFFEHLGEVERCSSIFSEPAKLVQFLLPLCVIGIFQDGMKLSVYKIIAIVLTILFAQAGNGIFGLAITFVFFSFSILNSKRMSYKISGLLIILIVCVLGVYYASSIYGQALIERSSQLSVTDFSSDGSKSGFMRIWRGYFVFSEFGILEQIKGCDNAAYIQRAMDTCSVSYMFGIGDTYGNTVHHILWRTGYIGLIIYIALICSIYKKTTYSGKCIVAIFVMLSLISYNYLNTTMCIFLLIPFLLSKEQSYGKNIIYNSSCRN